LSYGMVDDATALAFIFQNHFKKRPPTIELKTNFLYPTKPGKVIGYGRVVKSGKNIVFLEGRLEQNNRTVVTSTSTCVSVDMPQVNLKKMIGDNNEK
jgi:acyl-coenzyme A thioesterase PaaI-like protein